MPTISLRLTDGEHAQLEAWARDGHRSIQKEIIWRLFTNEAPPVVKSSPSVTADAQPRDVKARTVEVNPDFK